MATISFKAKSETIYNMDDTIAYTRVKVPALGRAHCDMDSFRRHPKYGSYANSDLFKSMLARIRKEKLGDYVRLDRVPEGVMIDTSGFLVAVSLEV